MRPQKEGDTCPWGLAFHVVFPKSPRPRRIVSARIYSEPAGGLVEELPEMNYPSGPCPDYRELYGSKVMIDREYDDVYDVHKLPAGRYRAEAELLDGDGRVSWEDSLKFEVGALPILKHKIKLVGPAKGTVMVGDVDGDGEVEYVHVLGGQHVAVYRKNSDMIWRYDDPRAVEHGKESAMVWDLNDDGQSEILTMRGDVDNVKLCLLEGDTGKLIKEIPFPGFDNDESGILRKPGGKKIVDSNAKKTEMNGVWSINGFARPANFRGLEKARDIMLQVGSQNCISVIALTDELEMLWRYDCENGRAGHVPMVYDTDNDGKDELIVGTELIDHDGKQLWEKPFEEFQAPWEDDHIDVIEADDINGDGKAEIVYSSRMAVDAESGERLWIDPTWHGQDLFIGKIRDDVPGKQVVFNDREYRHGSDPNTAFFHGTVMDVRDSEGNKLFGRRFMSMNSTQMLDWLPDRFRQICIASDLQRFAPHPNLQIFDGYGFMVDVLPGLCPHNITRDPDPVPTGLMISTGIGDGYIKVYECKKT